MKGFSVKVDFSKIEKQDYHHNIVKKKHSKCLGNYDYYGEFDCDYGSNLTCDDCKYGLGRKDPESKCNHE